MPTNPLHSTLDSLAHSFANAVLSAIRGASIQDLSGETGKPLRRGPGRPRGSTTKRTVQAARDGGGGMPDPLRHPKRSSGRLARRTPAEIAKTLASVVSLLKGKKAGLRSEQIRQTLKLDVREMPRVLKDGLKAKRLKSKGEKRATTYFST